MTNTAGVLNTVLTVPSYVEKVFVSGFMNSMELGIVDDAVQYTFGANSRSMQGTFTL